MKIRLLILCMLVTFSLNAQQMSYYYHGQKIDLTVSRESVNVIINGNELRKSLDSDFVSRHFTVQRNENSLEDNLVKLVFKTLPNEKEYTDITNTLRQNLQIKHVFPFFEREDIEPLGTSDIFYLKLKDIKDFALLKNIAAQQNVQILRQVAYMPVWYVLSVQNSVFSNAIDASNYFYETGHFANIDSVTI